MYYLTLKDQLIGNGYIPLPIKPKDKAPAIKNWTASDYTPPAGFGGHGVGIKCGYIAAVDLDITDESLAAAMQEFVLLLSGETIYRIGKPPKVLLVHRTEKPTRKKTSLRYECGRVEVLGEGQQFVAFGTHPDTKRPYEWPGMLGSILDVRAEDLPVIAESEIQDIIAHFEQQAESKGFKPLSKDKPKTDIPDNYDPDDPLDQMQPIGLTREKCIKILTGIDPDCSRDEWLNIGMALHHEFSGEIIGLELWEEWSGKGEKFKPGEPARLWESFGKYRGRPLTGAYLLKQAENTADEPDNLFDKINWSTARFLDDPPQVSMVIEGMLPRGIVSILFSAGGAGKSTVTLSMAIKIALGKIYATDIFNHSIRGGKVVIVTAEDPDLILNRRYIGIVKADAEDMGLTLPEIRKVVDENLRIVSTFGESARLFKLEKDTLKATKTYKSLLDNLSDIPDLQLVIIDTKTRYSPAEGQGNVTATQEVSLYEKIAKDTGATVMLLHHSNKASRDGSLGGSQAYRDVSALYDSCRAAFYLRPLTDKERKALGIKDDDTGTYLLLENAKNNYIPQCQPIILKREGYRFLVLPPIPKLTSEDKKEQRQLQAYNRVIETIQNEKKEWLKQGEIIKLCKEQHKTGRRLVTEALNELQEDGYLNSERDGITLLYALTEEGKSYNLTLEDTYDLD